MLAISSEAASNFWAKAPEGQRALQNAVVLSNAPFLPRGFGLRLSFWRFAQRTASVGMINMGGYISEPKAA
jgi:hypothetical protein